MDGTVGLKAVNQNPKQLPEQAAEQIVRLIESRRLRTGDKLPNEFELADQLQVGRGTVREAVKTLVSRNILEIRRGRGTFVCDRPGIIDDPLGLSFIQNKKRLALDLCEVRMMIEPEIAALAAQRATAEECKRLRELADEVEALCRSGEDHMEKDKAFHECLARCSRNSVVPNLVPVIQSAISMFITITDAKLIEETIRTHRMIVEAVERGKPQAARSAMYEHLEQNRIRIRRLPDEAVRQSV